MLRGALTNVPHAQASLHAASDLQDPTKLQHLTERFMAIYNYTYQPGSGATTTLTVDSGNSSSTESGASTVLASIISSTGSVLSSVLNDFTGSTQPTFSTALMSSIARLSLGG